MKKRLRRGGVMITLGILVACTNVSQKEETPQLQPPNIVLMIADDLAWDDLGCYGHPQLKTPNIDRLAEEGMLFEQAFLTASSCSPSRASIITGKYPHQTDAEQLHWPLPADQVTFVEKLKEAGYWTGQAGKWHLGEAMKDRFHQIMEVSVDGFQMKAGQKMTTVRNASGCEDWIPLLKSREEEKPFFLWLAAVDPHRDYKANIISNPHKEEDVVIPPYLPTTSEVKRDLALYYDEIVRLDSFVGAFMKELDEQGISENTVILFMSDNGRPFPRDKTTLYDGGIKTPFIVKWPGTIKEDVKTKVMISAVDLAPTLLDIAGVETDMPLEGESFASIMENPHAGGREYIYAEDHWHDFEDYSRAVRSERYKYIRNFYYDLPNTPSADALRSPTFRNMQELKKAGELNEAQSACFFSPRPEEELYDIEEDPYELHNLAGDSEYASTLKELREEMERVREATNDRLPETRTPDEFDRDTGQPNEFRIRPRPSKEEMSKHLVKI